MRKAIEITVFVALLVLLSVLPGYAQERGVTRRQGQPAWRRRRRCSGRRLMRSWRSKGYVGKQRMAPAVAAAAAAVG